LGFIGVLGAAALGCAHEASTPTPTPIVLRIETHDDVVRACVPPRAEVSASGEVSQQLKQLLAREMSEGAFYELSTEIRAGRSGGLPPGAEGALRAVVREQPVAAQFDEVAELSRQLADHDKKDDAYQKSSAGQTSFAELTLRRSLAIHKAARDGRRCLGELAERLASQANSPR